MMRVAPALLAAALVIGCHGVRPEPAAATPRALVIETEGMPVDAPGEALGAALWLHPSDPARNLLVGAAGAGGLVLRHVDDGTAYPGDARIQPDFVAVAHGFAAVADGTLVVATDRGTAQVWLYTIDAAQPALRTVHAAPLHAHTEITGLCLYRSPASGRHYAFVSGSDGLLQQWELSRAGQDVAGRLVRHVALGSGIGACAADDADGAVYVADESAGIWRVAAEPESDPADRRLIDLAAGQTDVKGLAVSGGLLLALLDDGEGLLAYALPQASPAGTFIPQTRGEVAALGDLESIAVGGLPGAGLIVLADPESAAGPRWRLLPWATLAQAVDLPLAQVADPRIRPPPTARLVEPSVETRPVDDHGDAADDIAIWVHPEDPARSLVIGAQKKRGIEVYDLSGQRLQLLEDGRMNNVDLRQQLDLGSGPIDIVAATNRTHGAISLYTVDTTSLRLRSLAPPIPTGMRDPYGLCMYVSARDGSAYVFANNSDLGEFGQWKLEPQDSGVGARLVREFVVGSQAEGCVADDETGALYVAEEDGGLWRYDAEPAGGNVRTRLDRTGESGNLTADAEGLALFRGTSGRGYLVLSNQGADNYAVYRREGGNDFIGLFAIGANDRLGIDGASETDGLEVTSQPLGPAFPHGLLVVQDGRNITPAERQNFKLVPWERVAEALGLD